MPGGKSIDKLVQSSRFRRCMVRLSSGLVDMDVAAATSPRSAASGTFSRDNWVTHLSAFVANFVEELCRTCHWQSCRGSLIKGALIPGSGSFDRWKVLFDKVADKGVDKARNEVCNVIDEISHYGKRDSW